MRIFFETDDLSCVSPATISRCGICYLNDDNLDYEKIIDTFFD